MKSIASVTDSDLHQLAFNNSLQANLILIVSSGKIIAANNAASKLLGYAKNGLLTKNRSDIFDLNESSFRAMLKQRAAEGQSKALVTVTKKNGKKISCEITSSVFVDVDGVEKAITTITDLSQSILDQKNIDAKKEKTVADNIVLAESKQKAIDIVKEKIVAENIDVAKAKQKVIDTKNKKLVADNIVVAKAKQKEIDTKKEKIVADNIVIAKAKQVKIDTKNQKLVAGNIVIANAKQDKIDNRQEKIVAADIVNAQLKSDARLAANNEWIKNIAKTSYDVMWDWDIESGEIYVGDSIEEVFGYKIPNNTINFKELNRYLILGELDTVEEKLLRALASSSKSWDDSFVIKRYDNTLASTTSRASIIRDEEGKAIRLIGAIQDISRVKDLESLLEEQIIIQGEESEKFHLAAKLSFDVIWDWNLLTDEVFIGNGFQELFGHKIKHNKGTIADRRNHVHPDDKKGFEKGLHNAIESTSSHWEYAYQLLRADKTIAKVYDRASIIRQANGKACRMIGAMQDLSRKKELEEKRDQDIAGKRKRITEYEENFKLIFNSSSDVLYDVDLATNEVTLSDAYEKEFGYKISSNMTSVEDWFKYVHPEDKEALIKDYRRMLVSGDAEWKYSFRFLKADGSVANVLTSGIVLRDADGRAYRRIGYMQDMSKQKILEERLEQEIKLKEKQIAEAKLEAKETERSDIGKELHDNVNQLLSASRMYLDMAKRGGTNSEIYLSRSSEYMITAIEEIRKLSKGLMIDAISSQGLCESIDNITRDIMEVNPIQVSCSLQSFVENSVNDRFKLNLFRIVQEQLSNILKHSQAVKASISLLQNKSSIILSISDNGIGFDKDKKLNGIGIANIISRASSYNGNASIASQPGEGCILTVTFPVTETLLIKG